MSDRTSALAIVAAVALALSAAGCTRSNGGPGPDRSSRSTAEPTASASPTSVGRTFEGNGVSFTYPEAWKRLRLSGSSASEGTEDWSETVGIDARNLVTVSRFTLDMSITEANIRRRSESIRAQLASLFAQAGGSLRSGPHVQEMGGLPGLSFTGTARTPNGERVGSRLVLAFAGTTEYFVNCQYDDAGRAEILSGCARIVSTFSLGG